MLLGRLRIRAKLALLLITPLLAMVGLAVPVVVDRVGQAGRAADTASSVRIAGRIGTLVQDLQQERMLSVGFLLGLTDRSNLVQQSTTVNDDVADLRANLGAELTVDVSKAVDGVQRLADVRTAVLTHKATPQQVFDAFGPVHLALLTSLHLSNGVDTATPEGREVLALEAVLQTDEEISAAASLLVLVVATKNSSAINSYITTMSALAVNTDRFQSFATPEQNALYKLVEDAVAIRTSNDFPTRLAFNPTSAIAGLSLQQLFPAVSSLIILGQFVEKRIVTDVINQVTQRQRRALTTAYWVGGFVLLILLVVVLLSLAVARAVAGPLIRLTLSADRVARVAEAELVRIADDESESVTPIRLDPVDVRGRDEIGDLARAFDRVQGTAARLVERQTASRRNVAQMFGHVGRRTQNLVGRQIALIDRLEHQETDPTRLQHLYRLDHVSSRLRRNASSLVVLSGSAGADGHVAPVPLGDVVRLALGEIEDYTRVDLDVQVDVSVVPAVIGDLVLALAELMENATAFSPPHTRVMIAAEIVESGVRLTLIDHGIGMTGERLAEENARMTRRERLDLVPTEVLGLFVVGRLARRHGWRVNLSATSGGGITVEMEIAERLLVGRRTEPSAGTMARASVPPPSLSWPGGHTAAGQPAAPAPAARLALAAAPAVEPVPPLRSAPALPPSQFAPASRAYTAPGGVQPSGGPSSGRPPEPVFNAALLSRASHSLAAGPTWDAFASAPVRESVDEPVRGSVDGSVAGSVAAPVGVPERTRPQQNTSELDDARAAKALGLRQRVPGAQLPATPTVNGASRGVGRNAAPQPADPSLVRMQLEEFEAGVQRAQLQQPVAASRAEAPVTAFRAEAPVTRFRAEAPVTAFRAEAPVTAFRAEAPVAAFRAEAPVAAVRAEAPVRPPSRSGTPQLTRRIPGQSLGAQELTPRRDRNPVNSQPDDPDEVRNLITQFESGVARALSEVRTDHRHEEGTSR
jgi:signal transduction histidine kinase